MNPTFGDGVAGAVADDALRCPGGRLTKIPYFRGGGSGGTDGGNDGSRILKSRFTIITKYNALLIFSIDFYFSRIDITKVYCNCI